MTYILGYFIGFACTWVYFASQQIKLLNKIEEDTRNRDHWVQNRLIEINSMLEYLETSSPSPFKYPGIAT